MLSSSELKKFFDEDHSVEQDGKRIYLVPLKEFMKTEEFSKLPSLTYIEQMSQDDSKKECHFFDAQWRKNICPQMIVGKSKSEKNVAYVNLYEKAVGGSFPNIQYEFYVRVNSDGTLNRDFVHEVKRARQRIDGKLVNLNYFKDGCVNYYLTEEPHCFFDPSV